MQSVFGSALLVLLLILKVSCAKECLSGEYECHDGQCISIEKYCDGHYDCEDGDDEKDCIEHKCVPPLWFQCKDGRCISSLFVCDGEVDCSDHSDELQNCTLRNQELSKNGEAATCSPDEFTCLNKECILSMWACDGEPDCIDGSDETVGCGDKLDCSDGFRCKNKHCIPKDFHCDGTDDCHDNSDEEDCHAMFHSTEECYEDRGLFLCHDRVVCIDINNVCDGFNDCFDKSDEKECDSNDGLNSSSCQAAGCSHGCHQAPHHQIKCTCPSGHKLDSDLKKCIDIDECHEFGHCHQKCHNTIGSFECSCDEGYTLQQDKRSCKAKGGEALMLFASFNQVRGIYLQSQVYFSVAKQLNRATGVSHNGHHVFWTNIDHEEESIVRSNEDGSDLEVLVDSGLELPEDLEVDYVTGNIYFTDADKKCIGVCVDTGYICTVLHNEDIDKPRSLALFPKKGVMYWSDWGEHPMIAMSGMDGSNPRPFLSDKIHWPNGLALDISNDRLYWVDAKALKIETVALDGSDRRTILEKSVTHPFSIAVFEDMLYWSDWRGREIQMCNKFTGKNHSSVVKEKKSNIYGVHIYHPALQPRVENPCPSFLCSDICMLAPNNSYSCGCPENAELAADKHTCREITKPLRFVVGAKDRLMIVTPRLLGRHDTTEIHLPDISAIGCMTYDSLAASLIISDSIDRKLYSYHLPTRKLNKLLSSGVGQIVSMSFDAFGNNLYYCDEEKKSVEVLSLTTKEQITIHKSLNGDVPISIVAVSEEGAFFVAVLKTNGAIMLLRVSLDGQQVHSCVSDIRGPLINLAYDKKTKTIFWTNSAAEIIESISVNCTNRDVLESFDATPVSIASDDALVIWSHRNSPNVYYQNADPKKHYQYPRTIKLGVDKDLAISVAAVNEIMSPNIHPCQDHNGGCSHACLVQGIRHGVCQCPLGMHLEEDDKNCKTQVVCNDSQFKCREDDMCIPKISRCDGHADCPSGDDEHNCRTDNCAEDEFKCSNGQCIPLMRRCDYEHDCSDRSDEINCPNHCDDKSFRCGSGECIPKLWKCDFMSDCKDGSDEHECSEITCGPSLFQCKSGTCLPDSWECDGDIDCPDASDEHEECKGMICPEKDFKCANERCISELFVCDGMDDCGDDSDELHCSPKEKEPVCGSDDFLCSMGSGLCVPEKSRCNGTAECPRGEDETDCSNCQVGAEFQCKNMKCIYHKWVCDKYDDCGDNSDEDEALCGNRKGEMKKSLPCHGYQCTTGECIPMYLVCNGYNNCEDGSDEKGTCETACQGNPCNQTCSPTPMGAKCGCHEGYVLGADGHSCTDIDECAEERCSQVCTNAPGKFTCSCTGGYLLKPDRLTCKASGDAMKFILAGDDDIRSLNHNFNNMHLQLYEPGSQILGIDVDMNRQHLYWTSGTTGKINIKDMHSGHHTYIENFGRPGKISFDWLTSNIYYIETNQPNAIKVCHVPDKKCAKVLTSDDRHIITNLVVDPLSGSLFYSLTTSSALERPFSKIYQYSFATQNSTLLTPFNVNYVSGIVVDHVRQHLYWSDLYQQVIEKIRFDGKDRQVVFKTDVHRPESLTLFEDSLYWLSKGSGEIKKCRLYGENKGRCDTTSLYLHDIKFLTIMHEARQPSARNPCVEACDIYSLCVLSPEGPKCICGDGTVLSKHDECDEVNYVVSPIISPRVAASEARTYTNNQKPPLSGSSSVVIAVLMSVLAICLVFASYLYLKKKKTSLVLLETMHFQNPSYGLSHLESTYHPNELTPGEHQYENPTAKLVQHPDGNLGLISRSIEMESEKKVIQRLDMDDYDSDSDNYDRVDMKANLIP
uniref:Vitellogenin receptor n=1 Tax=Liposcelis entomophila TaxID=550478 RepID=A0A6M3RE20_9NEOP|nr:vitellogenin receptor [Liposcelis entomophila]